MGSVADPVRPGGAVKEGRLSYVLYRQLDAARSRAQ